MPNPTVAAAPVIVIGGAYRGLPARFGLSSWHPSTAFRKVGSFGGVISTAEQDRLPFRIRSAGSASHAHGGGACGSRGHGRRECFALIHALRGSFLFWREIGACGRCSPPALLKSSLLDLATKWRLASEPLRHSHPPEFDESVAAFGPAKIRRELVGHLVAPFVSVSMPATQSSSVCARRFRRSMSGRRRNGSVLRRCNQANAPEAQGWRRTVGPRNRSRGVGSFLDALRAPDLGRACTAAFR